MKTNDVTGTSETRIVAEAAPLRAKPQVRQDKMLWLLAALEGRARDRHTGRLSITVDMLDGGVRNVRIEEVKLAAYC